MSFPNLDSRPPKALLPPKMTSFLNNDKERLPIPDKRTTSLNGGMKQLNDPKTITTTTSPNVVSTNDTPVTVKPNEYTKTSLDRPNSQERAKKRLILHQQQQQQIHQQQKKQSHQKSKSPKKEASIDQVETRLDPSDDVFVNYYKQVNSANKTFSTFRGPLPDPKKYLREEDQPHEMPAIHDSQAVSERFKAISEEKGEDGDEQEQNIDYTPLSHDTNYVKVSPPKLMRRQKKSGGSESDSSAQSFNAGRKIQKEKAQSPNKSNKKTVNFCTNERLSEPPDSANDSSNSDVFVDDPPPHLSFPNRASTSSNTSEEFPPPPPQLLEPTSEYISLENAEKGFLSQSFEDKCFETTTDQVSERDVIPKATTDTKVMNKIGTVFPRQILSTNKETENSTPTPTPNTVTPDQTNNSSTSNKGMRSVMELKLTLRLEGNGECQKMTIQEFKEEETEASKEAPESLKNNSYEFNSAIVSKICQAVTTIAQDQLVKDDPVITSNKSGNSKINLLYNDSGANDLISIAAPKRFQNSVYGLSEGQEKVSSQTFPNKKVKSPLEVCNLTLKDDMKGPGGSPKRQTLAEYGIGQITTVAEVHRPAENPLHNYTALDVKGKSDKTPSGGPQNQRYTSIKQQSPSREKDDQTDKGRAHDDKEDDDDDDDFEGLKSSVMTHMNWDDLMQEAKSLGIPLNRPNQAISSNNTPNPLPATTKRTTPLTSPTSENKQIAERITPTKSTTLASSLSHANRPTSIDSAVGVSSSTLSKSVFTLPKNAAPTLTSHTAALQKTNPPCLNQNCCCTSPCNIYDQPRNFKHTQAGCNANKQCVCNENLINCCRSTKKNYVRPEKRFHSFRIKLANLFCKRLCGRSSERQKQLEQQLAYKALSESYKCTCASRHIQPEHLSSTNSTKQLTSKKLSNIPSKREARRDVDLDSFLSDTVLIGSRNVHSTKSLGSDTCNHTSHRPFKHTHHSPDKCSEGHSFDLCRNLEALNNHAWYWGAIGLEEAENLLEKRKDGSFLVRDSSDERYILSLSFRSENQTHHTRIEEHKGRFSFFSHRSSQHTTTVDRFILEAMQLSKQGRSLYYLKSKHFSSVPVPVRLLYPVLKH